MLISEIRKKIEKRMDSINKCYDLKNRSSEMKKLQDCVIQMFQNDLIEFNEFMELMKITNDWIELYKDVLKEKEVE